MQQAVGAHITLDAAAEQQQQTQLAPRRARIKSNARYTSDSLLTGTLALAVAHSVCSQVLLCPPAHCVYADDCRSVADDPHTSIYGRSHICEIMCRPARLFAVHVLNPGTHSQGTCSLCVLKLWDTKQWTHMLSHTNMRVRMQVGPKRIGAASSS